jgi:hypothetical protein
VIELPACRETQFGLFTTAQADAVGIGPSRLRRLVAAGEIAAVRRGVYRDNSTRGLSAAEVLITHGVAAGLTHPGAAISHHCAALILGLPHFGALPHRPTLTIQRDSRQQAERRPSQRLLACELPQSHVEDRGTWALTSPARTVCDLSRTIPVRYAVATADAALNAGLTSLAEVCEVAGLFARWPGGKGVQSVLRLVDGGAESPYESLARLVLVGAGLSVATQVWAFDDRGTIGCGDLWLADLWTFLEVDGDVKYRGGEPNVLLDEKRRQERLEEAGFGVARVSTRQVAQPGEVLRRVRAAAQRGRISRLAQTPTGFIGPPPRWARRGTVVPYLRPPGLPLATCGVESAERGV